MTHFNPRRDMPYIAAVAQVVQFASAGYTLFGWRGTISGLFLGVLVSMTVAYATSQFVTIAKERKGAAMFFMVVLLAFSPIIVGAAAYRELPFGGWLAVVVAAAWGILPDFSVALDGFIAGKSMVKQDDSQPKSPAKPEKPKFICSCGYVAKSQAALNGHQRAHSKVVGYVASFEPVKAK